MINRNVSILNWQFFVVVVNCIQYDVINTTVNILLKIWKSLRLDRGFKWHMQAIRENLFSIQGGFALGLYSLRSTGATIL